MFSVTDLVGKDIKQLKVIVKTFTLFQKISISNKCCSFEIIKKILKQTKKKKHLTQFLNDHLIIAAENSALPSKGKKIH